MPSAAYAEEASADPAPRFEPVAKHTEMRLSTGYWESAPIRVALRVLPDVGEDENVADVDDASLEPGSDVAHECLLTLGKKGTFAFHFERCFWGSDASQSDVYQAVAQPAVDRVLMGQNASILAFGPTGTGKTYSLFGRIPERSTGGAASDREGEEMLAMSRSGADPISDGIVLRAVADIVDRVQQSNAVHNNPGQAADDAGSSSTYAKVVPPRYSAALSLFEVTADDVFDLTADESGRVRRSILRLAADGKGAYKICGCRSRPIESQEDAAALIAAAFKAIPTGRAASATVLATVTVTAQVGNARHHSQLLAADLCGSERGGAVPGRDADGAKSAAMTLLALGAALEEVTHRHKRNLVGGGGAAGPVDVSAIPQFRNCALTKCLRGAISGAGGACTLLITASPSAAACVETLRSLEFGERAGGWKAQRSGWLPLTKRLGVGAHHGLGGASSAKLEEHKALVRWRALTKDEASQRQAIVHDQRSAYILLFRGMMRALLQTAKEERMAGKLSLAIAVHRRDRSVDAELRSDDTNAAKFAPQPPPRGRPRFRRGGPRKPSASSSVPSVARAQEKQPPKKNKKATENQKTAGQPSAETRIVMVATAAAPASAAEAAKSSPRSPAASDGSSSARRSVAFSAERPVAVEAAPASLSTSPDDGEDATQPPQASPPKEAPPAAAVTNPRSKPKPKPKAGLAASKPIAAPPAAMTAGVVAHTRRLSGQKSAKPVQVSAKALRASEEMERFGREGIVKGEATARAVIAAKIAALNSKILVAAAATALTAPTAPTAATTPPEKDGDDDGAPRGLPAKAIHAAAAASKAPTRARLPPQPPAAKRTAVGKAAPSAPALETPQSPLVKRAEAEALAQASAAAVAAAAAQPPRRPHFDSARFHTPSWDSFYDEIDSRRTSYDSRDSQTWYRPRPAHLLRERNAAVPSDERVYDSDRSSYDSRDSSTWYRPRRSGDSAPAPRAAAAGDDNCDTCPPPSPPPVPSTAAVVASDEVADLTATVIEDEVDPLDPILRAQQPTSRFYRGPTSTLEVERDIVPDPAPCPPSQPTQLAPPARAPSAEPQQYEEDFVEEDVE